MTGEILGEVKKEGNKIMPFSNEDSKALEQVGWRGCVVSFLGNLQDWSLGESCLTS